MSGLQFFGAGIAGFIEHGGFGADGGITSIGGAPKGNAPKLGRCSSFTPGTYVLMADGSYKPIEDVEVDDEVLATDPETGETRPQPVLGTITSKGDKNLVQITVDSDAPGLAWLTDNQSQQASPKFHGLKVAKAGALIATDNHPFWVAGDISKWVEAADLKPGMWLRTSAGTYVQVTATEHRTAHHQRVHNLTVANLHTYYVEASDTPVLVHNAGCFNMTSLGGGSMLSPAGLIYNSGSVHGHRLRHVLAHSSRAQPDASKAINSQFNTYGRSLLQTVDEAWAMRGVPTHSTNRVDEFVIPMGREVGTRGEQSIKIIVEAGSSRILTAHPVPF